MGSEAESSWPRAISSTNCDFPGWIRGGFSGLDFLLAPISTRDLEVKGD